MTAHFARAGSDRLRIVVLGYIVRGPLGGLAWHHLQYVMGLARLGHDVYFLEDSGDTPWCCYDPNRHVTDSDPTYGLAFAADVFEIGGAADRWAYYDAHRRAWHGPCAGRVAGICGTTDLLVNLGGVNPLRSWLQDIPRRALVDTDPVFTQIRHLTDTAARKEASRHTAFFSFAENIGTPRSSVPADAFDWQPTRQPIVLDAWTVQPPPVDARFTTVMQWNSYPAREYRGTVYGMKSDSFAPFLDLPSAVCQPLEMAVGGDDARNTLTAKGWIVRNPLEIIRDARSYQRYLTRSKAEFSVAKHGYVIARTGWFSERSAAYLASGRPVVTQETGFTDWLPSGAGVMAFTNAREAADAIGTVNADYAAQSRSARLVAEEYFGSDNVLSSFIERAMSRAAS